MKIVSTLFALVLAVSLVLVPAAVWGADEGYNGLANCEWDPVKWESNPNSWVLYLQHWGRTPIQAMSRLSGLCGPDALCSSAFATHCPDVNACLGGCPACRTVEEGALATCSDALNCEKSLSETSCTATGQQEYKCPAEPATDKFQATCGFCWGVSLAFANKSWAAADIGTHPRINNNHLNHFGTGDCGDPSNGGDWGISGCPHTECCSLTWCLQDNCLGQPYGDKCAPN